MARLIYSAITSLEGYVSDEDGDFGWATPDEEVHTIVNDLERPIGTYLYGRGMYEVIAFWEATPAPAAQANKAGLVDEHQLLVAPILVGGGNPSLPRNVRVKLELLGERRFRNGMVHLRYRIWTLRGGGDARTAGMLDRSWPGLA